MKIRIYETGGGTYTIASPDSLWARVNSDLPYKDFEITEFLIKALAGCSRTTQDEIFRALWEEN